MTTENLSLLETKHLVEKSRGRLTMVVLRDSRKFLVSIPEVEDSPRNSGDERHGDSSELEGERWRWKFPRSTDDQCLVCVYLYIYTERAAFHTSSLDQISDSTFRSLRHFRSGFRFASQGQIISSPRPRASYTQVLSPASSGQVY